MNFSIGDTVGGYEIVGVLGSGGMGEVYRVRNVISDRVDAMKVLLASLQRDHDFATRFVREIKVQARLVHPNIAQLYTAFEHQGNLMMILELVNGLSLLEMLQCGRVPIENAVNYASQALDALSYAHTQGVIHRDIKPGNIMVTRTGAVKLMDFGIAKAATDRSLTMTGNLIGSLYYMSPEQVRAETIDSRSDLYSVGVVLYQMATGRKPFEGDSEYKIMQAQVEHAPPPPNTIDASVPEELSRVILRALSKRRDERFQTGEEFRAALQQVAAMLQEPEFGATRMFGASPGAARIRPAEREVPTFPRESPAGHSPAGNVPGEQPAPPSVAQTAAPPHEDRRTTAPHAKSVAAEPRKRVEDQPSRSQTPLWIGAAVAAAVLVVAGTQIVDWMASDGPERPIAATPASGDLQAPPAQPPAQLNPEPPPPTTASPRMPETAAGSTPATPAIETPRQAPGSSGATPNATPGAASRPVTRESPRQTATAPPAKSPAAAVSRPVPVEPVPTFPTPAAKSPSSSGSPSGSERLSAPARPPAKTPTETTTAGDPTNGAASSAPSGAVTKTASPPAAEAASPGPATTPVANTPPAANTPVSPAAAAPPPAVDRVYEPSEVDATPRLVRQVQPLYTEAAQKAGVQGRVRLAAEIWPDGRAHNIRVVQSVGHPDLDRNAIAALSLWQFVPGRKDGAAVKVRALIDQSYRLQGGRSAPALSKDQ
jgi:serine/threonine-protein kinase